MVCTKQMIVAGATALVIGIIAHCVHYWAAMPMMVVVYATLVTLFYIDNKKHEDNKE